MIEIAAEQDGPQILCLTDATGVFKPVETACVQELWATYLQQGEASGYVFLVERAGEQIRGYACFGPHPLTEGIFDLYWIAVAPEAQNQGVGRALLTRVEDEVHSRGGRMILIETSGTPAYAPARRLYESCGYRYEAVIHDFYAQGDDLILFSKPLNRPVADPPFRLSPRYTHGKEHIPLTRVESG
jgi:ribosomal protein S18 acetylase RimI-like enzyme